ncbi:hypothetical protein ElyMa_006826200 [Elysia marginata]|uniref:HTH psq-type domain-containing protein n=1 Tax=Elysia marginata TaxID=1093978 RepID=A0AAV4J5S4_9GAST|nr:hypothetical protein ElyMa_006826200 [Elysia marginata]
MNKLQKYYTKAIRSGSTVEEMKSAGMATFKHCTSTDEEPHHDQCPQCIDSWCFYQRALAWDDDTPPSHMEKISCYLIKDVAKYVRDVDDRLSDEELLSRCLEGKTQNANESLHSMLWNRCPKHIFVNRIRNRLETALALGVAEFNQGSVATAKFIQCLGFSIRTQTRKIGQNRDGKRLYYAQYSLLESTKRRKEIQDKARQGEQRKKNFAVKKQKGKGRHYTYPAVPTKIIMNNSKRKQYVQAAMDAAVEACRSGLMKQRKAAAHFNVPRSTLGDKVKGLYPVQSRSRIWVRSRFG